MNKNESRIRRALRSRKKMEELGVTRLVVYKSSNHIYAQVINNEHHVIASASTLEKDVKSQVKHGGSVEAAKIVGSLVAQRATNAGASEIAYDRSGYLYHGRVKALAESAREGGLKF